MKKLLLPALTLFRSFQTLAFQKGNLNVNAGVGLFGSRGLLGVSADKFLTENHAVSSAIGLDVTGNLASLGYKYFFDQLQAGNSVWDKCFFLFKCGQQHYMGSSIQYASGPKVEIRSEGSIRKYQLDQKLFGLLAVGTRDIFENNLTFDFEISYRGIVSGGRATQESGSVNPSDLDKLELGFRSFGIGTAIGYLFYALSRCYTKRELLPSLPNPKDRKGL